jgi:hypothetical protein
MTIENDCRKKKIGYLLVLLLAHQIMVFLITPLLVAYLFEEHTILVDLFAQGVSFIVHYLYMVVLLYFVLLL